MAIRGVNLAEKEAFILVEDPGHPDHADYLLAVKQDKGFETPTIFYLGNLTANDRVELGDMGATPTMRDGSISMHLRNIQKATEVVRRGLKGWDNMLNDKGSPVTFEQETVTVSGGSFQAVAASTSIMHLAQDHIIELSEAIMAKNGMSPALEKKSEGASPLQAELNSAIGDAPTTLAEPKPAKNAGAKSKRT